MCRLPYAQLYNAMWLAVQFIASNVITIIISITFIRPAISEVSEYVDYGDLEFFSRGAYTSDITHSIIRLPYYTDISNAIVRI